MEAKKDGTAVRKATLRLRHWVCFRCCSWRLPATCVPHCQEESCNGLVGGVPVTCIFGIPCATLKVNDLILNEASASPWQ